MRDRINGMRLLFQKTMSSRNTGRDWSFITQQTGMFSFSGLKPEQVDALREKHGIYFVRRPHQRCRHERRLDGSPLRRHRVGLVIP